MLSCKRMGEVLVEFSLFLWIGQNLVCQGNFFEFIFGLFVFVIFVGVILQCKFSIGFFYFCGRSVF